MHESNLKKNTLYNLIKTLSVIIFPLISFPYISRVLQPKNIGRINFSKSIISYVALIASLGISTYALKECPKVRDSRSDLDQLASEIYTLNIITTIISYLVLAIFLLLSPKIRSYGNLILFQSTLIGVFEDDTSVGIYSTAVRIYYIISMGITSIINVVIQRLSYSYAKNNLDKVKETNRFALSYIIGIGFPVVAGVIMLAPEIISFIGGESYMGAVPVLVVFMIAMTIVMFGGGYLGNIIMLPSGRDKLFTKAYVISVVENIILNAIFIPLFGFVAASVTTLLAELTIFLILYQNNKGDFMLDCRLSTILKIHAMLLGRQKN